MAPIGAKRNVVCRIIVERKFGIAWFAHSGIIRTFGSMSGVRRRDSTNHRAGLRLCRIGFETGILALHGVASTVSTGSTFPGLTADVPDPRKSGVKTHFEWFSMP